MNISQLAARFGCTEAQARALMLKNAAYNSIAAAKADQRNGKYRGYTADQYRARAATLLAKVAT